MGQPSASVDLPDGTDTIKIVQADSTAKVNTETVDSLQKAAPADSLNITPKDSLAGITDSLTLASRDSLAVRQQQDSLSMEDQTLKAAVFYTAKDSIIFTNDNMGYLYGDADIKYGELSIKGENITMDMDNSIIAATFGSILLVRSMVFLSFSGQH